MQQSLSVVNMEIIESFYQLKLNLNRLLNPFLRRVGVTFLQMIVLNGVGSGRIRQITDVSAFLEVGQGNASTLCKKLETDGFLKRERSRTDERVVNLFLTEKGSSIVEELRHNMDEVLKKVLGVAPEAVDSMVEGIRATNRLVMLLPQLDESLND